MTRKRDDDLPVWPTMMNDSQFVLLVQVRVGIVVLPIEVVEADRITDLVCGDVRCSGSEVHGRTIKIQMSMMM